MHETIKYWLNSHIFLWVENFRGNYGSSFSHVFTNKRNYFPLFTPVSVCLSWELTGLYEMTSMFLSTFMSLRILRLYPKKERKKLTLIESALSGKIKFLKILFCVVFNVRSISQNSVVQIYMLNVDLFNVSIINLHFIIFN